jgi:hypothetical protein
MNDAFRIRLLTLIGTLVTLVLGMMVMSIAVGKRYATSWSDIFLGSLRGDSVYDKNEEKIKNPYTEIYVSESGLGALGGDSVYDKNEEKIKNPYTVIYVFGSGIGALCGFGTFLALSI